MKLRFELNVLFWQQNEESGTRQIRITTSDRVFAVVTANRMNDVWCARFLPMGFAFESTEMSVLVECINRSTELMKVLIKPVLTMEEVQEVICGFI